MCDPKTGRVVSGYGILQPRVSVTLPSANRSRFAHLFSGGTGLDPYTTACSDLYQDLFKEGSYTGKALYVVDDFERALEGRVPENQLLSHDLFEGCFARSGLVSDIELFDDYPSDYETYSKRQHRWVRGDWQIAAWIWPWVPTASKRWAPNVISLISRWKILDNLRRSLVPITVLAWLVLAWLVLPGSPVIWTSMVIIIFCFPVYATVTNNVFHHRQGVSWRRHMEHSWLEAPAQIQQILLMLAFLSEQAWNQADAIIRSSYRMVFSHKHMLAWVSFAQVHARTLKGERSREAVGPAPFIALTLVVAISLFRTEALWASLPLLLAWLFSPMLKDWVKKRGTKPKRPLLPEERTAFRLYARRTWHFFETFVTKEDNFLAPDNFQEEPNPVVARRTSPTNIGLQLLSLSSAWDLGYVGFLEFVEKAEATFRSLVKLERMHGHFFNWYSTETLEPLRPQYISTVDSGNLAGHLLALKHCFHELESLPSTNPKARDGL
ncbi:MAG: hypothetical protein ABL994_15380, partial [Verrucomicrobiales bacterium]